MLVQDLTASLGRLQVSQVRRRVPEVCLIESVAGLSAPEAVSPAQSIEVVDGHLPERGNAPHSLNCGGEWTQRNGSSGGNTQRTGSSGLLLAHGRMRRLLTSRPLICYNTLSELSINNIKVGDVKRLFILH